MNFSIPAGTETHKMFGQNIEGKRFKGMTDMIRLGSGILNFGILIPLSSLDEGFRNLIWSILLVSGLITLIAVGAWRYRSNQLKAEERLMNQIKHWVELGMPSAASFEVQIHPIDVPLTPGKHKWVVKRREAQFLWSLNG